MAIWQADFHFTIAASDLPDDYRERFSVLFADRPILVA
jgi:hypothetical protein